MNCIDLTQSSDKTVCINNDTLYVVNNDINVRKEKSNIKDPNYLIETTGKNINIYNLNSEKLNLFF